MNNSHSGPFRVVLSVCALLMSVSTQSLAAFVEEPSEITLKLIDSLGNPVPGASVGRSADGADGPGGTSIWTVTGFEGSGVSDADGRIKITHKMKEGRDEILYVLNQDAGLVAIHPIKSSDIGQELDVRMIPATRVRTEVISRDLPSTLSIGDVFVSVLLNRDETRFRVLSQSKVHRKLEFLLPPGAYTIYSAGGHSYLESVKFDVEPEKSVLQLEPVDLKTTHFTKLIGQDAPELVGIKGWKNTSAFTLKDLRGSFVLLKFWGHWCGPCVNGMPSRFALHDEILAKNLDVVLVGVHDDSVESIEELDKILKPIRNAAWDGRDIPFRVVLDGGGDTKIEGTDISLSGRTSAKYGPPAYPTTVLIDPAGKVVGEFEHKATVEEELAQLEDLIKEHAAIKK